MEKGKVPENVLKRSVFPQIRTKRKEILRGAGIGCDCATFSFPGEGEMLTCVQEAALASKGAAAAGDREEEAFMTIAGLIQKCANNLAAGGGRPVAVLITLLLPEETAEPEIRMLMEEAGKKCGELSLQIAGGQTRITGAVRQPVATVTGFARAWRTEGTLGRAEPGQDLVVSKWIGLQGTAWIAIHNRTKLLQRYPAWLVDAAEGFGACLSVIPEAEIAVKAGVCAMHDASEGGIFGALWEMAEGAGVGLTVDMRKLPLRQETVEICEYCGVNPYELLSGGCLLMATRDGPGLTAALEAEHIPAVIVGRITDNNDRILMNGEEIRYMDRPKRDSLFLLAEMFHTGENQEYQKERRIK